MGDLFAKSTKKSIYKREERASLPWTNSVHPATLGINRFVYQ